MKNIFHAKIYYITLFLTCFNKGKKDYLRLLTSSCGKRSGKRHVPAQSRKLHIEGCDRKDTTDASFD